MVKVLFQRNCISLLLYSLETIFLIAKENYVECLEVSYITLFQCLNHSEYFGDNLTTNGKELVLQTDDL